MLLILFIRKAKRGLYTPTAEAVENVGTSVAPSKREAYYVELEETARLKDVHSRDWVAAFSMLPNLVVGKKVEGITEGVPELDEGTGSRLVALIDRHGNESPNPSAGRFNLVQRISENHRAFFGNREQPSPPTGGRGEVAIEQRRPIWIYRF